MISGAPHSIWGPPLSITAHWRIAFGRVCVRVGEGRPIILRQGKESADWTKSWNSSGPPIKDKLNSDSELSSIKNINMTHAHGHWYGRIQRGANAYEVGIAFLIERGSRSGESSVLIRLRVDHPNPSPSPLSSSRHQCYHWDQTNLVEV